MYIRYGKYAYTRDTKSIVIGLLEGKLLNWQGTTGLAQLACIKNFSKITFFLPHGVFMSRMGGFV